MPSARAPRLGRRSHATHLGRKAGKGAIVGVVLGLTLAVPSGDVSLLGGLAGGMARSYEVAQAAVDEGETERIAEAPTPDEDAPATA